MYPLDPVLGVIVCGSFALLFAIAAAHKLRAPGSFAETLTGYQVLPAFLVVPGSILLPLLEGLVAVALLLASSRAAASVAGSLLLTVYAAAMGLNLLRGRRHLDCGCLGPHRRATICAALVWRNLLLALVLLAAGYSRWTARPLGWLDVGTILVAVCVLALLYAATNGLLALTARHSPRGGWSRDGA